MLDSDFNLDALVTFLANFVKSVVDWYGRLFKFANDAQTVPYVS